METESYNREVIIAWQVLEYIKQSEPEDFSYLNVDWLARKYKVTPSYLSKAFKKEFDFLLGDFIKRVRIMHGARLLVKKKKLSIRKISEILDFGDSNSFIRAFKEVYGITPETYRVIAVIVPKIQRQTRKYRLEKEKRIKEKTEKTTAPA
ncbi:MAG: helix-turn-helix domain-containing protein [Candidatus Aminicenantes bacterium]|nr:helix-turn-helix domain-containing protein [Candidatus Aminicenantes bacterium]NIM79753.1 helix-turn-helix domain-containing protein [Candidatus Aminicenantes bacterium]NIN19084.1 helix-turn-helix domain-containing protein [Candidatus Aminicenantes bacterium]NIN42986.1 helix-turn-helix domain-containing protein [Candidatus Aminicenantes bacterium]NIN85729.1 helix-turn-helix domain-containing protein [Candidatus Aminicenantes bacterium]